MTAKMIVKMLSEVMFTSFRQVNFASNKLLPTLVASRFSYYKCSFVPYRTVLGYNANYSLSKENRKEVFEKAKANLVLKLNFQSAEDALPFYSLPHKTLLHIYKTTLKDEENGYCKNRLYYIAHRIQCSPAVLSERLVKRTFVYSLSFDWIKSSLDVLLEMGVPGERILRDLWVLKYHHKTIHYRLERVKNMGIDTLYPWMVRCSEGIMKRFIDISQETKDILGDSKSTQIYLANRLNTSPENIQDKCLKIPALKTIRVVKVKKFLDFLINEGFQIEDIANKPRVLTSSQKTVESRLKKLRSMGLTDINLNVLCRSKKDFKKFCEVFEDEIPK